MSIDLIKHRTRGGEVTKALGMGAIHSYPMLEGIGQRVRGIFSFFGVKFIILRPEKISGGRAVALNLALGLFDWVERMGIRRFVGC